MSRFGRIRRRPDHWSSTHERARVRAAERLDGPLGLTEATWLDEHLAGCAACTAVAAAYAADRDSLRTMRSTPPEPPRDLWARTSAAIETESARHGGTARTRDRRVPLGALSGLAVIAVVVGVSTVSSGLFMGSSGNEQRQVIGAADASPELDTTSDGGAEAALAEPTPIAVAAGAVKWFDLAGDGTLAYNDAAVDEVCAAENKDRCGTLTDASARRVSFDATPETVIAAPNDEQAVVVSRDADGAQRMVVVQLPRAADETAVATIAPDVSAAPPSETPTASTDPLASETPPASADPLASAAPGGSPDPAATASVEATPSEAPATPSESPEVAASGDPVIEASADPSASPLPTPEATVAASLPIASQIEVIGEAAAFSEDGAWFAFTARPAGAATGSDVYLWKVGDADAHRLTTDGTSSFASWSGDQVVVSRPLSVDTSAGEAAADTTPSTVTIDPVSLEEQAVASTWRPAVDPSGQRAVAWAGTVRTDDQGGWHPADGRLELQAWPAPGSGDLPQVVAEGDIADFDVRWDETGEWVAVWTADAADPALGRLTLHHVDPETGRLDSPDGAPTDVPALPGFSIGDGRLAWATPPGQGGEGSRVQIVAWDDQDGVGGIETAPGEMLVVIR